MSIKILSTGIVADQPTRLGSTYSREALERAIKAFNIYIKNHRMSCAIIDRENIERTEPIVGYTESLFFNDSGMLCARVKIQDDELVAKIESGLKIIARPIISVPSFELDRSPLRVTNINKIIRIQLECDEPERSENSDQESRSDKCQGSTDERTIV